MSFNGDRIFAEPKRPTAPVQARCYSERCCNSPYAAKYGVNPKAKPHAKGAWCPDCGHALVWERVAAATSLDKSQKQVFHKVKRSNK